jgi:MoxR-like ATPase
MSNQNQVNLNIEEVKDFLKHIVDNNRYLQSNGKKPVAVEIIGESGIGKTSSVLQLTSELNFNCVKLNLAQIEELGDLVGFPVRQFQLCKQTGLASAVPATVPQTRKVTKTVDKVITEIETVEVDEPEIKKTKKQVLENGKLVIKELEETVYNKVTKEIPVEKTIQETIEVDEVVDTLVSVENNSGYECLWIDENAVQEYIKRGYEFTGEKRMSYCPPEWIADKQGGGVLILDDWNRADIRFIQAVMELVDRQEYISWKLPKDWHIILTANPDNGSYLVQSIDTAQRTRFVSVNLKFDAEVWARWAENEGIDGRCINFLLMHPELVNERVNPRSITTFFNCISSLEDFAKNLPLVQMIGEGSVGPEFSTIFTTFINNKLDKLVNPKDILLNDNESYIIGEIRNSIGRGVDYRADIASIIATRIINYTLVYAKDNTINQKITDRLIKINTDSDLFTNDLQYVMVKQILNGNKQKFQKLMANPEIMKMAMK